MTSQANTRANVLAECLSSLKTWKESIGNYLQGEEKEQEMTFLEDIVKEFCLIDFNHTKSLEACQDVTDHFNEDSVDRSASVEDVFKEKLAAKQNTFNDDYRQQKIWKEIFIGISDRDVEEVEQTVSQSEQETEYEEMHDSIFYSNVFTPPVDPISKMVIKNPYKNKSCGHIYEYKFILQYIKSMKKKAKCPYIGCGNENITVGQLVQDNETKEKIENYIKTNKSETPDDD